LPFDYVVLKPSIDVCVERAANRAEGKIEYYTQYKELYASFDTIDKRHVVSGDDLTTSDVAVTAARVREGLETGRFRIEGKK
jgi:hypothetical protein